MSSERGPRPSIGRDPEALDADSPAKLGRAIRFDLLIAVCALLMSTLATAASWWQTRVIAQQLSAQVWPYASFTQNVAVDRYDIEVSNDGLGPAVVKSFVLDVDGKPQPDFTAALRALVGRIAPVERSGGRRREIRVSAVNPGAVLRPSSSQTVFAVTDGPRTVAQLLPQLARVKLELCYCSILGTCWNVNFPGGDPQAIAACPDRSADQLRDPSPAQVERHTL